jgi:hypothetical protein
VTNDTTRPTVSIDYELITDSILYAANIQAAVSQPNTRIDITHRYEYPKLHDDAIRMLLTVKVRNHPRLRYRRTLLGVHTFRTT